MVPADHDKSGDGETNTVPGRRAGFHGGHDWSAGGGGVYAGGPYARPQGEALE